MPLDLRRGINDNPSETRRRIGKIVVKKRSIKKTPYTKIDVRLSSWRYRILC